MGIYGKPVLWVDNGNRFYGLDSGNWFYVLGCRYIGETFSMQPRHVDRGNQFFLA